MTLAWDPNGESDLAGYIVQYGTQAGNPSTNVDVGNVTSRQFSGLQVGVTYYFRVVAYNTTAMQSGPSTEVSSHAVGAAAGADALLGLARPRARRRAAR